MAVLILAQYALTRFMYVSDACNVGRPARRAAETLGILATCIHVVMQQVLVYVAVTIGGDLLQLCLCRLDCVEGTECVRVSVGVIDWPPSLLYA